MLGLELGDLIVAMDDELPMDDAVEENYGIVMDIRIDNIGEAFIGCLFDDGRYRTLAPCMIQIIKACDL